MIFKGNFIDSSQVVYSEFKAGTVTIYLHNESAFTFKCSIKDYEKLTKGLQAEVFGQETSPRIDEDVCLYDILSPSEYPPIKE